MSKKIYSTKVVSLGGEVGTFIAAAKMIILFEESLALPELRDMCVMHTGNQVDGTIQVGDILRIGEEQFNILKVGSEVQTNLTNLGHITLKFDGGKEDLLEGSIHLEEKEIPEVTSGTEISIIRA